MALFHRPPRLIEVVDAHEVHLPTPPVEPQQSRRASLTRVLLMTLLPAILPPAALDVATAIAGQPGTIFITSVALASSMAVAIAITTVLSRRDEAERERAERTRYAAARRQYELELAVADAAGRVRVDREARILRRNYPAPAALGDVVDRLSPALWERRPAGADFLDLRLGTGRRPTSLRFPQGAAASDPLARALVDRYATLAEAPLTASLRAGKRAGIFGDCQRRTSERPRRR